MPNLPLTTVELVSTLRPVPLNGSPSSQDYNDDQRERIIDLAAVTDFINDSLIPLLQVLPILAQTAGIEGRAVNTDSTDLTSLCFNPSTSAPLTIAQSLKYLQSLVAGLQGQYTDISTQVAVVSSKLSATNQNDISLALQNFQSSLNAVVTQIVALQTQVTTIAGGGGGGTGGGGGSVQAFQYVNSIPNTIVDFSLSINWKITLVGATTISFTNAQPGMDITVILTQDNTGNWPVAWDSNIKGAPQPGGSPAQSTVYKFTYDGTTFSVDSVVAS